MNSIPFVRNSLATAVFAVVFLGGCSWFHHKDDYYNKAAETRPLEVPPDLDTPVASNELVVPATSAGAPSGSAPGTSPPSGVSTVAAPVASSTVSAGNGLRVADSADHTWQRVGLALERAQVGTISARDAGTHSYTVEVAGLSAPAAPAPAEEHHWYTRIMHPFGGGSSKGATTTPVSGNVTVRVSAEGSDAARVDVEGASSDATSAEAARRVLAVLRERLS